MKKTIVEILKKEREEAHDDLLIWANDDEIQSLANKIEKQLLLHNVSNQRELLKKWWKYFDEESVAINCNEEEREEVINDFFNCG